MRTKAKWIGLGAAGVAGAIAVRNLARAGREPRTLVLNLPGEAAPGGPGSIFFVGTATTIIRYSGFTILTDPNFLHRGERVHLGYGLHATRLTDPAVDMDALPPIDFVVLSHLHEDHFDKLVERRLDRSIPILTTTAAARALARKGFGRTIGLNHWDSVNVVKGASRVSLTSTPGRHGPMLAAPLLPPVMGSLLSFEPALNLYLSGDTTVYSDLEEIPLRYPNIDLALLHLGGTRILGLYVTMDGAQGLEALRIVNPKLAIPIHYNDYRRFQSPLEDFVREVSRAGLGDRVRYLAHGDTFAFRMGAEGLVEAGVEAGRGARP